MFKTKILKLRNYAIYMMFLEMNKMLTETLLEIKIDKTFKLYAIELIESIKDIALAVEAASESNIPEYTEYVTKLTAILGSFADKKEDGSADINSEGIITIDEDKRSEYNTLIKDLIEEYKDVLKARQEETKVLNDFMDKDIEVEVPVVPFEIVSEYVTTEQMRFLRHVILKEDKS